MAGILNGQQMGGKRRSAYHYDLWSMKYLPKFKWDHLTEEICTLPPVPVHYPFLSQPVLLLLRAQGAAFSAVI